MGLLVAALGLFGLSRRFVVLETITRPAVTLDVPPVPARPKLTHAQAAKLCRRVRRAKQPARFGYFGKRARYHFDPATSNANRHKRTFGGNFDGLTGQHALA